jgi:NAD(P)-dependent dehydrogenase (short-subunit alcohol dehydrogenase family)
MIVPTELSDMRGKTVLITGANSGIGFETAAALARRGASIAMVCRDPTRGAEAREKIARIATAAAPDLLIADLSSQAEIRALATGLRSKYAFLSVVINNAGAVFARRELSIDGIEKTFALNHLAPFLFTHLILDLLRAAPSARVINIASALHNASPDVLENLQGERKHSFMLAYKQSKLGVILFTYELAHRLEATNISVNCVEPGPTATRFGDNMHGLAGLFPRVMKRLPFFQSPERGARSVIYAASSPELEGETGKYLVKSKPTRSSAITYDTELRTRHWAISQQLCRLAPKEQVACVPI